MKVKFTKVSGILAPFGPDADAWMAATKTGQVIEIDATRPRNTPFLKKYFALLNYAYSQWDVPEHGKNYTKFRRDLTIQAGHYTETWNLDGKMELEADSISFAKMEQAEFDALYSKTLDILLEKILPSHNEDDINRAMSFM